MIEYKDQEILEGILNHDHRVLNYLYSENLPMIENLVRRTGGNSSEAGDIFQEAMLIIYRKVIHGELELRCKFSTYFYSICKNLRIQEVKNSGRNRVAAARFQEEPVAEEPDSEYKQAIYEIFDRHFDDLSPDCQQILMLHFRKMSIDEIREILGQKDSQYVMDKKYRCKKNLIKKIMSDPGYKEIYNGIRREVKQIS